VTQVLIDLSSRLNKSSLLRRMRSEVSSTICVGVVEKPLVGVVEKPFVGVVEKPLVGVVEKPLVGVVEKPFVVDDVGV
jgi:hypothetical protein